MEAKSAPFSFVQFLQQEVPPCELTCAQLEGLRICPAVTVTYVLNKSQLVKSLGSLPFISLDLNAEVAASTF